MTPGDGARSLLGTPLLVLLFASTLGVLGGAIIVPVLEVIRGGLGLGDTETGLILTTHGAATALASPLTGRLVDRFGIRRPLAVGLVVYGLGGGAGTVVSTYPALLASRFVFGIGAAMVFTATTVALLALHHGYERDRIMGWRSVATTLGGVLWPLAAGVLGGFSWHTPFAIYLIGLPLGMVSWLVVPEVVAPDRDASSGGVITLLRGRAVLAGWYVLLALTALMMFVIAVFMPARLTEVGIVHPLGVAVYSVVVGAVVASLVGLLYARLRAAWGHGPLLRIAAAAWTAGFLVFATADSAGVLLLAPALTGLGTGIVFPAITVLIDNSAPTELRGQATSLQGTVNVIGQFSSPLLFGPLVSATSITVGALVAAGLAATVFLVLLIARVPRDAHALNGSSTAH